VQDSNSVKAALREVLSSKQFQRLVGIALQVRAIQVLVDRAFQTELGLTPEQGERIAVIHQQGMLQIRSARGNVGEGRGPSPGIRAVQEEMQQKSLAVLTPAQTEKLDQMKGARFDLDPGELLGAGGQGPLAARSAGIGDGRLGWGGLKR
jgi:hypothetical protein